MNEALKLALESMERFGEEGTAERYIKAKAAIKEALAQPEQEPVAYLVYDHGAQSQYLAFDDELGDMDGCEVTPLYTHPPVPTAQPKQCTNSDSWNCKYCTKTKTCDVINDHRNFGKPKQPEQEPVAHSVVEPLRHDEYQRRVSVKWVNQPVAGPLYTTPPQSKEPEQEPVAITITGKLGNIYSFTGDYSLKKGDKVYTTPQQRKPLTDEQLKNHYQNNEWLDGVRFAEQFHGIKENT